jgi:threonine dehydratase
MRSVSDAVSPQRIPDYEKIIRPHVRRTPVIDVDAADFGLNLARLYLKLELFQHSGSFKARGAFANLLTRKVPGAGVAAASGGNHGVAVAYAANKLRFPAKIFLPSISSPERVRRRSGDRGRSLRRCARRERILDGANRRVGGSRL